MEEVGGYEKNLWNAEKAWLPELADGEKGNESICTPTKLRGGNKSEGDTTF